MFRWCCGAGGAGVAVVSGILGAEDVEAAARRYVEAAGQRGSAAVKPSGNGAVPDRLNFSYRFTARCPLPVRCPAAPPPRLICRIARRCSLYVRENT